jgi:integrase
MAMAGRKAANKEGSLYRVKSGRKAGRWVAAVTQADGKRRVFYADTREQAHERLTAMLQAQYRGVVPRGDRLSLGEFLTDWLANVKAKVRPSTFSRYSQFIKYDISPALGAVRLDKLSPADVEYAMRERGKTVSPRTVQHMRAVLRTALNHALAQELVVKNAAALAKPPRVPYKPIEPLDPGQAQRLLEAARGDRLAAAYAVAIALGLRQGELLGLRWEDVDLEAGTIRVGHALQKIEGELQLVEVKTRGSHRTVNMPAFVAKALVEHRQRQEVERDKVPGWVDSGFVFTVPHGEPLDADRLRRSFAALLTRAGLPRMRFYDLRHACASLLLSQGVPLRSIMELLGHSTITLTANTYTHLLPAMRRETADAWDRLPLARGATEPDGE